MIVLDRTRQRLLRRMLVREELLVAAGNEPRLDAGDHVYLPCRLARLLRLRCQYRYELVRALGFGRAARRGGRRWLVRPLFSARWRFGAWYTTIPLMKEDDPEKFFNYFRMSPAVFDELVAEMAPELQRRPVARYISPGERLALTLRYLASGDSQISLSYAFLIATTTVSFILRDTCAVLWRVLCPQVFRNISEEMWLDVARGFDRQWQVPHCIGALDGRHCVVQNFPHGGTDNFNYKKSHSMVLMALCDSSYRYLPPPEPLLGGNVAVPYFIVGDSAFELGPNMMTPFGGVFLSDDKNIYNYRMTRARRVIENAFGVMSARFRILRRTILGSRTTVRLIIQATTVLHNYLLEQQPAGYADVEGADGRVRGGRWRQEVGPDDLLRPLHVVQRVPGGRPGGLLTREALVDFFLGPGRIHWQWRYMRNL